MSSPTETVIAFLSRWDTPGGLAQAIRDFFTPDAVWENVGMSKTAGPEEAIGVLAGFGEDPENLIMRVDTLAIAVVGQKVLTERIDHIVRPDGQSIMAIPLMGIFEIKGDKIGAWRDYFDTAGFSGQGSAMN